MHGAELRLGREDMWKVRATPQHPRTRSGRQPQCLSRGVNCFGVNLDSLHVLGLIEIQDTRRPTVSLLGTLANVAGCQLPLPPSTASVFLRIDTC